MRSALINRPLGTVFPGENVGRISPAVIRDLYILSRGKKDSTTNSERSAERDNARYLGLFYYCINPPCIINESYLNTHAHIGARYNDSMLTVFKRARAAILPNIR